MSDRNDEDADALWEQRKEEKDAEEAADNA